jgi:hypothetical protein
VWLGLQKKKEKKNVDEVDQEILKKKKEAKRLELLVIIDRIWS